MNVKFNLRQSNLMNFFDTIIILNFIKSELFSLTRHRPLKDLFKRLMIEMQYHQNVIECLYSATHLNHFFKCTIFHTTRIINNSIDFLRVNCVENSRINDTDQCINIFFELNRNRDFFRAHVIFFITSFLFVVVYSSEIYNKLIRSC